MQKVSDFHGIKLVNIPLGNLREQFLNHYRMAKSDEFASALSGWQPGAPIRTPYLSWYYWPDQLFTHLAQVSIMGLESYVVGATYFELGARGKLEGNVSYLQDPFSIRGENGTAAKYYKLLPALAEESFSLPNCNQALWDDVRVFYKELRNPLFHGKQLDTQKQADLVAILELLASVYGWIDSWHDPDSVVPGSSWYTKLKDT